MNWGILGGRSRFCHAQKGSASEIHASCLYKVDKQGGILVIPGALCVSEPSSARSSLHLTLVRACRPGKRLAYESLACELFRAF